MRIIHSAELSRLGALQFRFIPYPLNGKSWTDLLVGSKLADDFSVLSLGCTFPDDSETHSLIDPKCAPHPSRHNSRKFYWREGEKERMVSFLFEYSF